jgi:hypothetical protein
MTGFHARNAKVLKKITIREKPGVMMYCSCGFSSSFGNKIGMLYGFSVINRHPRISLQLTTWSSAQKASVSPNLN